MGEAHAYGGNSHEETYRIPKGYEQRENYVARRYPRNYEDQQHYNGGYPNNQNYGKGGGYGREQQINNYYNYLNGKNYNEKKQNNGPFYFGENFHSYDSKFIFIRNLQMWICI